MSREIKFRAWDKNNKGFINGFNMIGFSSGQGAPKRKLQRYSNEWNEEDIELMQCTGLIDKNDRWIYEGDIVNYTDGEFTRRKGKIEFDCFGFMLSEILSNNREYPQIGFIGEIEDFEEFAFEVIGNIYENPELLDIGESEVEQ